MFARGLQCAVNHSVLSSHPTTFNQAIRYAQTCHQLISNAQDDRQPSNSASLEPAASAYSQTRISTKPPKLSSDGNTCGRLATVSSRLRKREDRSHCGKRSTIPKRWTSVRKDVRSLATRRGTPDVPSLPANNLYTGLKVEDTGEDPVCLARLSPSDSKIYRISYTNIMMYVLTNCQIICFRKDPWTTKYWAWLVLLYCAFRTTCKVVNVKTPA